VFYILRFNYLIAELGFIKIFVCWPKGREIRGSLVFLWEVLGAVGLVVAFLWKGKAFTKASLRKSLISGDMCVL